MIPSPFSDQRLVAALAAGLVIAGCMSTSNGTAPPAVGATSDAGIDAAATAPASKEEGLTCLAVLQCAVACAETDAACQDACLAHGDADARAKATAFVDCVATNACANEACIKASCNATLTACLAPRAQSAGRPLTGAVPGSIPPAFVGAWKYTSVFGTAASFTFNADGTTTHKELSTGSLSGCTSSVVLESEGTAVFDATETSFVFYVTKATTTTSQCGQSASTAGSTGAFDFTLEPIPALGPGHMWIFRVQDCPVTAEADKRVQCGNEYDL